MKTLLLFSVLFSFIQTLRGQQSTIVQEKQFGGSLADQGTRLALQFSSIPAGASIWFSGQSASNNGDVSGNHGSDDAWLMRMSSFFTVLFSKLNGGSDIDEFSGIQLGENNISLLVGSTSSPTIPSYHAGKDIYV